MHRLKAKEIDANSWNKKLLPNYFSCPINLLCYPVFGKTRGCWLSVKKVFIAEFLHFNDVNRMGY